MSERIKVDVVVIGSGNAGQAAALDLAASGRSVAVVESAQIGGVCPNRGCVPKKVLVAAAEALDTIRRASTHCIDVGPARLDFADLIRRKRQLIAELPEGMENSLRDGGVDIVKGHARFVGHRSVEVGERLLDAGQVVVATGSKPRSLPLPGAEHLLSSDDFLEQADLPDKVAFIGAGAVAMEFSHVLARAGSKVTLFEVAERPLANFDEEAVRVLVDYTRSLGVEVFTGAEVEGVEHTQSGFTVKARQRGESVTREVGRVFNGAGRIANLDGLGLEQAGITLRRGRVHLDEQLRSIDNPSVYFCGDSLADSPQLSPVATYEGHLVAHNLIHPESPRKPDYSTIPSAVYSIPTLAMVGLSEAQAKAQGRNIDVKVNHPENWLSGRTYAEQVAFAKLVVEADSGKLLGAHLLGHGAPESIHFLALAMQTGVAAKELESFVYAYPTFTNDLKFYV